MLAGSRKAADGSAGRCSAPQARPAVAWFSSRALSRSTLQFFPRSRGSGRGGSVNDTDAIFATELVGISDRALRIVMPLAVYDQSVLVAAGREGNSQFPNAFGSFFQGQRSLLPAGEVAGDKDALRSGCNISKRDFLFC